MCDCDTPQGQSEGRKQRIVQQTRQLILMRETGPKSARWHAARVRMIWRLHDELRRVEQHLPAPPRDDSDLAP